MPPRDPAAYMRDYRAQKAGTKRTELDMETGEIFETPARFACGCEPGLLCMSHGIANMSQVARDKVLSSPEINRPGRRGGKE